MGNCQTVRSNFHTHTIWCDGKDSLEKTIEAAVSKNLSAIGFSPHLAFPLRREGYLDASKADAYTERIKELKDKYAGKISVFRGGEADYIQGLTAPERSRYAALEPDYLIGSVHSVIAPDKAEVMVDFSPEALEKGIKDHFAGSAEGFAKAYFEQQREMVGFDFDVLGHPDLLRKFNAGGRFFDEKSRWYVHELEKTADAVAAAGKTVEVNTGAIARGLMDDAYPSETFRNLLRERGVRFILSSDAHAAESVDAAFDRFCAAEDFIDFHAFLLDRRKGG